MEPPPCFHWRYTDPQWLCFHRLAAVLWLVTVTDNAVYTGQWAKNSSSSHHSTRYTLHYESNGGTAYGDERYSSGTKVTLTRPRPASLGTLTGWYVDKALTQKITTFVTMNSDKTVLTGWEATGVPTSFNGDDHFAYVIGYPTERCTRRAISASGNSNDLFRLLKADIRDGNLTADNDFSDVSGRIVA